MATRDELIHNLSEVIAADGFKSAVSILDEASLRPAAADRLMRDAEALAAADEDEPADEPAKKRSRKKKAE